MKKILEIEILDNVPDWKTTNLPKGVYYSLQFISFYEGDHNFPRQLWCPAEYVMDLNDSSSDDIVRKSAIVRVLTGTIGEQETGLLRWHLNQILSVTEIYHVLAACKLVSQVTGKPFTLPKDLVEIKEL